MTEENKTIRGDVIDPVLQRMGGCRTPIIQTKDAAREKSGVDQVSEKI